jgi:hypothetical protein
VPAKPGTSRFAHPELPNLSRAVDELGTSMFGTSGFTQSIVNTINLVRINEYKFKPQMQSRLSEVSGAGPHNSCTPKHYQPSRSTNFTISAMRSKTVGIERFILPKFRFTARYQNCY